MAEFQAWQATPREPRTRHPMTLVLDFRIRLSLDDFLDCETGQLTRSRSRHRRQPSQKCTSHRSEELDLATLDRAVEEEQGTDVVAVPSGIRVEDHSQRRVRR